jgi:hypothetical protein
MPEGYHIQALTAKRRAFFAWMVAAFIGKKAHTGLAAQGSNPAGERR